MKNIWSFEKNVVNLQRQTKWRIGIIITKKYENTGKDTLCAIICVHAVFM